MGFSLSLPKISVQTEKGIPRYNGKDIFLFNGEELVLKKKSTLNTGEEVYEYVPRVQTSFTRIQHIVDQQKKESHWKVTTNTNTISCFGTSEKSRICNPEYPVQIFEWLIAESVDSKGNKIVYSYKSENEENIPDIPWEQNRSYNNKYIQNIQYGNYIDVAKTSQFAFELVFDYGEYDLSNLHKGGKNPYIPVRKWKYRPDAFSSYKSGFEIRTCRLCYNIMLFHHFENEIGDIALVKNLNLSYQQSSDNQDKHISKLSVLQTVTLNGYRRSGKKATDAYNIQDMPPITFGFSKFDPPKNPQFKTLEVNDGDIPGYLNDTGFQPVDLNSEGLPGFLYHDQNTILYYESLGDGNYALPEVPESFPSDQHFTPGKTSLEDLNGDGALELVVREIPRTGYYERNTNGSWKNYIPFTTYPTDIENPDFEMAGLSNNGKTDAMLAEATTIKIYPSLGKAGYAPPLKAQKQPDFPSVKKDYPQEYTGFADIMGDGLPHRVKVINRSVECWPDLGYGAFDKKVVLGNAPDFGAGFDKSRLFFADIDGSGTADMIYIDDDCIKLFINQNGNTFSNAISVPLPEPFSDKDQINFADILGSGTTCLVFSKMDPRPKHYYYDFTGETPTNGKAQQSMKPYLLHTIDNNMGAHTQIHYCSSVKTYLEDKANGRPWITKLPFPVQVVKQITHTDAVTGARYARRFKFHDGFYDHAERKFQGFGYVESWDTETYENFIKHSKHNPLTRENYVPPVYTRTWHNTGALFDYPDLLKYYEKQYFQGDKDVYDFPGPVIDDIIHQQDTETLRQAYTALKGHVIRTEVYGEDKDRNPGKYKNPYTVAQSNAEVRLLQLKGDQPYAVFMANPRESISYHYERNPEDPGVQQQFALEVDDYGNTLQSCVIYLPRRPKKGTTYPEEQTRIRAVLNWQNYVRPPTGNLFCHISCEQQQLELSGLGLKGKQYFTFQEISAQVKAIGLPGRKKIIPYGDTFTTGVQARQVSWNTAYFWDEQQTRALPLGKISPKALLHHREEAVFTKAITLDTFDGRLIDEKAYDSDGHLSNIIYTNGGYFYDPASDYWWNKGLTQCYFDASEPERFYLPSVTANTFALETLKSDHKQDKSLCLETVVAYDDYALYPATLTQILDSNTRDTTRTVTDYISCQPKQLTDINDNTTQLLFDPLGQVIVTSVFGTENGAKTGGMTLYADGMNPPEYRLPAKKPTFEDVLNEKTAGSYLQGASSYFYYNLNAWAEGKQPVSAVQLVRNNYWHSPDRDKTPYCKKMISYSDGFGRILEEKLYVDPGMAFYRDTQGKLKLGPDNCPILEHTDDRWQVNGRTVYNNKGKPSEQYLPYFINTAYYESQEDIQCPPPTVIHYDPLEREIRIDTPKGFFSKIEFTPWEVLHYDEDDTVLDSSYYKNNYPANLTPDEKDAIDKAAKFYNTPHTKVFDTMGSVFLEIQNNLGNVSKDAFDKIISKNSSITSQEIWEAMKSNGYLVEDSAHKQFTWLTDKFQPYTKGFVLNIGTKFNPLIKKITEVLLQNCLTSHYSTDISGRITESVDPRLYYTNISKESNCYNFKYQYAMGEQTPLLTNSIDAGPEKHLSNIFGEQLWSWNARDYCQFISYDRLQRKTGLSVKKITTKGSVTSYDDFTRAEVFTYGENVTKAEAKNLRGQVYQIRDLSGIIVNESYSMLEKVMQTSRKMIDNHKTTVNWDSEFPEPVPEGDIFCSQLTYNALGSILTETTTDGSVTTNTYNKADQLDTVSVMFKDRSHQQVINHIEYDARGQQTQLVYGNGIQTVYSYDSTTLQLIALKSTRPAMGNKTTLVQDIAYYYDPVGNITRTQDNSITTVFHNNQKIKPLLDYTYDALYRLTEANGRQHRGINANTYKNNTPQNSFKQSIYGPAPSTNDANALENYKIYYGYDNSGNLVKKHHTADITPAWSRKNLSVAPNSNRLKNLKYDASGNLTQLDINNTVTLSYNCCENLVKAGIIERPDELDDCDYYLYDYNDRRIRKVSERMAHGGSVSLVEEKTYFGNYEVKKNKSVTSNGKTTLTLERQTLRVMDGDTCVAIIHYTVTDKQHPEQENTRQCRFQMDNNLGSVSLEMDANGLLISYEEYFPYGGTAIITGKNQAEVKLKDYRYSGKERDDSTGLYYYGARYYAPWLGRWLKPDPAGTIDGMNLYAFVGGNPVSHVDIGGFMKRHREATKKPPDQLEKPKGEDFASKSQRARKSPRISPPTEGQEDSIFTATRTVGAILKFDGKEILYAENGAAAAALEFHLSGLYNQKGQKINPHAEDWAAAGFLELLKDEDFKTQLKKLPEGQVQRHVASLKINFSPCTGCVETIVRFNRFLKETFGEDTMLRVKFLRPYDLPITLQDTEKQQAITFRSVLERLETEGIPVRLHPDPGTKGSDKRYNEEHYSRKAVKRHASDYYEPLTQTWRDRKLHRKEAA